jgi:hypothetical protein
VIARALSYFQLIMVIVYLGLGLLLLFSPNSGWVSEDIRKWLAGALLVYGTIRGFMVLQKRKNQRTENDHH